MPPPFPNSGMVAGHLVLKHTVAICALVHTFVLKCWSHAWSVDVCKHIHMVLNHIVKFINGNNHPKSNENYMFRHLHLKVFLPWVNKKTTFGCCHTLLWSVFARAMFWQQDQWPCIVYKCKVCWTQWEVTQPVPESEDIQVYFLIQYFTSHFANGAWCVLWGSALACLIQFLNRGMDTISVSWHELTLVELVRWSWLENYDNYQLNLLITHWISIGYRDSWVQINKDYYENEMPYFEDPAEYVSV